LKAHHDRPWMSHSRFSPTIGSCSCRDVLSVSSGPGEHRADRLGSAHGPASRLGHADVQARGAIAASPSRRTRPPPLLALSAGQDGEPLRDCGRGLDADGLRTLLRLLWSTSIETRRKRPRRQRGTLTGPSTGRRATMPGPGTPPLGPVVDYAPVIARIAARRRPGSYSGDRSVSTDNAVRAKCRANCCAAICACRSAHESKISRCCRAPSRQSSIWRSAPKYIRLYRSECSNHCSHCWMMRSPPYEIRPW
jgi:hypothetical protein